ncbi:hypothetical protein ACEI87_12205 [Clostridioides difficile]|nr:hypothetical protein [Clostridioides difficile]
MTLLQMSISAGIMIFLITVIWHLLLIDYLKKHLLFCGELF